MRFLAVDWGTSRFRARLVDGGRVLDRRESDRGIAKLRPGEHERVFHERCGPWLAAEPELPTVMAGMVGSREGWFPAPYVPCPAGSAELATSLMPVLIGGLGQGFVVPGVSASADATPDVMRGEETHLIGSGVRDGIVCLPGTHCKWARMEAGRIVAFATFLTGELFGLLREHSMVGRPATDPPDEAGFGLGLATATGPHAAGGLLNLLFGARARTLTGELAPAALGPFLSGLLTAHEIEGATRLFGRSDHVTVIADPDRAALYRQALATRGIETMVLAPESTLLAGLTAILAARR